MLRDIRRTEKPKNGSHSATVSWEWNEGHRWNPYDSWSIKIIEQNYQNKTNYRFSLSNRYSVELQPTPMQINNHTGFQRCIRRQAEKYVEILESRQAKEKSVYENEHANDSTTTEGMYSTSKKSFLPQNFNPKTGKSE